MDVEVLIRRAATAMVGRHHQHASAEAAKLATESEQRGDTDGTVIWCLILDAMRELPNEPGSTGGGALIEAEALRCA